MTSFVADLVDFLSDPASSGWRGLPFFADGHALRLARLLDEKAARGTQILPPCGQTYQAFRLTPLERVTVVLLGQDPYPTPGHAHGLAFSYRGTGSLPASLRRVFRELQDDLGARSAEGQGDLSGWASQGVLLLNAALTVEAGKAGSHLRLGWEQLADEAVRAVSDAIPSAVFVLWGDKARARRSLIDARHLVIESAHPSPLAARGDFLGSRPFSRANRHLSEHGIAPIDWLA